MRQPLPAYRLAEATGLLARTPRLLAAWFTDLDAVWLDCDEGQGTWSPRVVLGHLVVGERTDWMERVRHILAHGAAVAFSAFDREAQFREPARPLVELLAVFAELRARNLAELVALQLQEADLARPGLHPALGPVTLGNHLATWVAHDLTHITQIARTMAKRYQHDVGPWREYLRVVRD